ncbi:putative N terminal region of Chorein or VPS13 Vacuolar sorting associated protein 13 [Trypanosoma vivax]|nr:putative N terminal region of Chorein or VPS13 Vacuolar sorting associated protein 13 [Trypanosoma vivax]
MLEKYLSSILVPYLSKFAENFDAKQLNVDLWNGNVVLKDLVLKPSVLEALLQGDSMSDSGGRTPVVSASPTDGGVDVKGASVGAHLPITMQRGICRRINFVVPYTQLRSKPVVMEVGELFISLKGNASNRDVVLSKVAKLDAQAAYKERELEQFEAERRRLKESNNNTSSSGTAADSTNASGATGSQSAGSAAAGKGSASSDGKEGSGYFSRLSEIVINNLVIKVQSVHIRYEDEITKTVMGAILGDVRLFTIDSVTGEAKFVDAADMKRIPKRLEFSGLQFYCDDPALYEHGQQQLFTKITDVSSWLVAMRSRVEAGDLELSTVIGPVSGHVDVNLILKNFVKEMLLEPYMIVRMRLDCFAAKFNRAQYLSFVRAVSLLSNWTGLTECLPPRPKVTVVGNATVWWRYATNAVRAIIGAPRRERLLKRISEVFIVDYHILYRDVVRKVEMSPEKQRAYRFITRFMTVPDMIAGRKYVYAQLANAIQLKRKDNEAKKAEAAVASKSKKKTWFSWSRGTSTTTQPELSEEDLAIIELERAYGIEPSDKVGEDVEASGEENKLPDSYCWLDAQFELPMLSASLGLSKTENVELMLHNVSFLVRKFNAANSLQLRFVTNNLTLSNPVKDDELLSRLPSLVEGLSFRPAEASCSTVNSCTERQSRHGSNAYSEIPLLECSAAFCPFEQPIEDTQLDFMMDIRLLPLRIVADPPTIDSIVRFFQVPKGLNLTAIVCHTKSIAATVGQVASTELRLAMNNTKSYKISLDASAPHIILPKSLRGSVDEPTLAVSLGRAKFDTQPLTETEKRRRIELLHNGDASEDWLYYSSRAIFSQFYVELAPLNSVLDDPGSGFMLVPEVAFSADVLQRIDDDTSASREQLIVRMEVPKLCMACSLSQAHILSSMVERWLLYLGAEEQLCDEDAQPSSSLESTVFNPDNIMSGATTGLRESPRVGPVDRLQLAQLHTRLNILPQVRAVLAG